MTAPILVTHFSDVLCVWAYIAQRRMEELKHEFGNRVEIDYRLTSVFGFARDRLDANWKDQGGLAGYARHVRDVVSRFDHVEVHDDSWARVVPLSSWPAHLMLAAIRVLETAGQAPPGAFSTTAWRVRQAFFRDARDVSRQDVLLAVAAEAGLDVAAIQGELASGAAHAALALDDDKAKKADVRLSPSIVIDEGRQRLNGNVGYRVIATNIREILEAPVDQCSWC